MIHWLAVFLIFCASCSKPMVEDPRLMRAAPKKIKFKNTDEDFGSCTPTKDLGQADCPEYHVCLPVAEGEGVCMIDCGEKVEDKLVKRHDVCPKDYACLLIRTADLSPVGLFCEKPQSEIDMPCVAAYDEDACAEGLSCIPTIIKEQEGESIVGRNRCKAECSVETACLEGEECLAAGYARNEVQSNKPCDVNACLAQDESCICELGLGFSCQPLMDGLESGICIRKLGICGTPISWASLKDFHGESYLGKTCNEMNESRLCAAYDTGEVSAQCKLLGKSGEGLCIAPCMVPTFDGSEPLELKCPDNFSCKNDVAQKLGMIVLEKDQGKPIPCDEKLCPKNQPCPTCGDASCIDVGKGLGQFCGAYLGTCVAD